ncbi:hypothetical protein B0H16DRAFT_1495100 [Mycena metata]|uniref:Uncharacterized protein n=1 Tax=Mycena metata TaxID=1033252 RepID=A0AAD7KED0_9AGAR|nr:hypothetical protein B0H16DRAFT_1495100 [Mycena metata]
MAVGSTRARVNKGMAVGSICVRVNEGNGGEIRPPVARGKLAVGCARARVNEESRQPDPTAHTSGTAVGSTRARIKEGMAVGSICVRVNEGNGGEIRPPVARGKLAVGCTRPSVNDESRQPDPTAHTSGTAVGSTRTRMKEGNAVGFSRARVNEGTAVGSICARINEEMAARSNRVRVNEGRRRDPTAQAERRKWRWDPAAGAQTRDGGGVQPREEVVRPNHRAIDREIQGI